MRKSVAVIAAHPDDEVLGCGGTIARMSQEGHEVNILLVSDGESSRCEMKESIDISAKIANRNIAAKSACEALGCASVEILSFPDNRLDGVELLEVIKPIEDFMKRYQPTTVFTHYAGDLNVDHQAVSNAVITACRPSPDCSVKELLFFEVPSSTEWNFSRASGLFCPNWFVDVTSTFQKKIEALDAYKDEMREFPHPRSFKAIEALANWRGATAGIQFAEAFILGRKIL